MWTFSLTKFIFSYLVPLVAVALALKLLVVFLEPHLTFFPIKGQQSTPASKISHKELSLKTSDGENIHAWLLQPSDSQATVVFFHGNGGNLSLWQSFIEDMYHHSLTVLAVDYRGYGKSSGSPSEQGLYRDTEALLETFWREIHQPDQVVFYWGKSLGGPVAAYATTLRKPDGLILEATFPNKKSLLNHYPILKFLSLFSTYQFPTTKFLEGFSRPTLLIHGQKDEVVPFSEGEKLFEHLRAPKYFHAVPGAGHNDLHLLDHSHYWGRVTHFIETILRERTD